MNKRIIAICIACLCLAGCASGKEDTYSRVEAAYQKLQEQSSLSYEQTLLFAEEEDTQRYVVEKHGGDWKYSLYIGSDTLLQEEKYENGRQYIRMGDGEWQEEPAKDTAPVFLEELLVDVDDIDTISSKKTDDGATEVSITLSEAARKENADALRARGEEAVAALESSGASDIAVEGQKEHNQALASVVYLKDEQSYVIDENGVLTEYVRTVVYEEADETGNLVETEVTKMISVHAYEQE